MQSRILYHCDGCLESLYRWNSAFKSQKGIKSVDAAATGHVFTITVSARSPCLHACHARSHDCKPSVAWYCSIQKRLFDHSSHNLLQDQQNSTLLELRLYIGDCTCNISPFHTDCIPFRCLHRQIFKASSTVLHNQYVICLPLASTEALLTRTASQHGYGLHGPLPQVQQVLYEPQLPHLHRRHLHRPPA